MMTSWDAAASLDRMVDDVMRSIAGTATSTRAFDPSIDVRANQDALVFVCDVPGLKQDDLDITLENHVLTIAGTRKYESSAGEQVLLGRAYGSFKRVFTLPDYLDESSLEAALADGVLTIRIPKQPKAKPRKILVAAK